MFSHHHITREPLSVRERMSIILERVSADEFIEFTSLFSVEEGRAGVIVSLLAILELLKDDLIEMARMVSDKPLSMARILALFEKDIEEPDREMVKAALDQLQEDYKNRGIEVCEVASGYRVQVKR